MMEAEFYHILITRPRSLDRALASNLEEPHPVGKLLPAWRSRSLHRQVRRLLQPPTLSREPEKPHARRCLLWTRANHPDETRKDQTRHHPKPPLAASKESRLT